MDDRRAALDDATAHACAVVLAGGEGIRLRSLTRTIVGDDRPKQYVPLISADSLLPDPNRASVPPGEPVEGLAAVAARSRVRPTNSAHDRRGTLGRRIVRVLDMKSTDPIVELRRQARESSNWHSTQRVDLVRSQLNSELETRTSRVPKEVSPETGVRQQATERSFHVSLTHASSQRQGLHQVSSSLSTTYWCDFARERVNPHLNVELRTIPETVRAKTARSTVRSRWRTPCTGPLRRTRS